jgi:hypothetical protein
MAKDRNTFAKRQREVERKRKATEKRERRAKKKQHGDDVLAPGESRSTLSPEERSVLRTFRNYLMTPGQMFCFGNSDLETLHAPLAQLMEKGMLNSEKPKGGYSLTQSGFLAMKNGE